MNTKSIFAGVLIATASAATALAQQSDTAATTTITSEPGNAAIVSTVQASAEVVGIDKGTRTVTLKTPKGNMNVVAGDAVKNFDQIKVGDIVTVRYTRAAALKLIDAKEAAAEAAGGPKDSEGSTTAPPGAEPAFGAARKTTSIAEVTAVDPQASTITLKGENGKIETVDVRNPDQFKVVKPGDKVQVTYAEAVAVAVEPEHK
jgi:ribosomal 50S subunit-recycling heat shock protein